jgi:hypothetical protein
MPQDAGCHLRPDQREVETYRNCEGRAMAAGPMVVVSVMMPVVVVPMAMMMAVTVAVAAGLRAVVMVPVLMVVMAVPVAVAVRIVMVVLHGRFPSRLEGVAQMPQRSRNPHPFAAASPTRRPRCVEKRESCYKPLSLLGILLLTRV